MTDDSNFHTGPFGERVLNRNQREIALNSAGIDDDFPNAYVSLANSLEYFLQGHADLNSINDLKQALQVTIPTYEEYLQVRRNRDRQRLNQETGQADTTVELILGQGPAPLIAKMNAQVELCNQRRVDCVAAYDSLATAIRVGAHDEEIKQKRGLFGAKTQELDSALKLLHSIASGDVAAQE